MNSDIILEVLLRSDEDTIIKMCRIDKRTRYICLHYKNSIAKHIMEDIYKLYKPQSFVNYSSFYKHFKKSRKSAPYLYGLDDNPTVQDISRVYRNWYKYIDSRRKFRF